MVSRTSATALKLNGLAALGSSSCQTGSTPMPRERSQQPSSGSKSNRPVALVGEVKAIDSGWRRSVTVSNGPRATTVRDCGCLKTALIARGLLLRC